MPLSDAQKTLLYEIYGIPDSDETAIAGDVYTRTVPVVAEAFVELRQQLKAAIVRIDANEARTARVSVILQKYQDLDLDPSNIDRNGYALRYQKSIRELKRVLFAYTGIVATDSRSNTITLG